MSLPKRKKRKKITKEFVTLQR